MRLCASFFTFGVAYFFATLSSSCAQSQQRVTTGGQVRWPTHDGRQRVSWRTPDTPVPWNSPETLTSSVWRPPDQRQVVKDSGSQQRHSTIITSRNSGWKDETKDSEHGGYSIISDASMKNVGFDSDRSKTSESEIHPIFPDIMSRNSGWQPDTIDHHPQSHSISDNFGSSTRYTNIKQTDSHRHPTLYDISSGWQGGIKSSDSQSYPTVIDLNSRNSAVASDKSESQRQSTISNIMNSSWHDQRNTYVYGQNNPLNSQNSGWHSSIREIEEPRQPKLYATGSKSVDLHNRELDNHRNKHYRNSSWEIQTHPLNIDTNTKNVGWHSDSKDSESQSHPTIIYRPSIVPPSEEVESGRHIFDPGNLAAISETLGAINTLGKYLVNVTRTGEILPSGKDPLQNQELPGALYTISKNVLGRNVTDTIAPLVRGALPPLVILQPGKVTLDEKGDDGDQGRPCTTPDGRKGICDDLSNCPQLLLDLGNLRQSICFKSLFIPGVCCPRPTYVTPRPEVASTTRRPPTTTRRPPPSLVVTSGPASVVTLGPTKRPTIAPSEECGQPEVPAFRVVGGEESLPGRWPWMAAIFLHGARRTEFWCGGSLVGPRHVLTAAHCTRDSRQKPFSPRQFTVRLGDVDLKRDDEPSSPETFRVVEVRAHPRFSRVGFYNDIALMVLDHDYRHSRYVIPLCLPPARSFSDNFVGQKPTVVGWGTTYYGGKESTVQRQAQLPVWRNDDCDRTYFQPITSSFICAGYTEGGKDACQGDSGGPLMLKQDTRWMQIGIVSFGNKCGEPGYPGVYTRITEYVDWIKENMVQ